MRQGIARL